MEYSAIIARCETGLGTGRNLIAAAQWYCRAALDGGAVDMYGRIVFPLADKFNPAPPPPRNIRATEEVSAELRPVLADYLKAAARHDARSAMQLGSMYLTGKDAPHDAARAWPWFSLASQYGAPDASTKLSEAESKMTAVELERAKKDFPAFLQELQKIAAFVATESAQKGIP